MPANSCRAPPPACPRAYADSKTLNEEKREALFRQVDADPSLVWAVDVLSAADISRQMLSRCGRTSLNAIAAASTKRLIQGALDAGIALQEVSRGACLVVGWEEEIGGRRGCNGIL